MSTIAAQMRKHRSQPGVLARAGTFAAALFAGVCVLVVDVVLSITEGQWQG